LVAEYSPGLSSGSRKTRIETEDYAIFGSRKNGLSSGSRKTRIETGGPMGFMLESEIV